MDSAAVLALFDARMRADPPPKPGLERAWFDGVLRTTGSFDFIDWWDFPAERAAAIAEREAAFFRPRPAEFEWKVHSHDGPPGLERALTRAGFEPQDSETLLVLDIAAALIEAQPPNGVAIRLVRDEQGVADYAAASGLAFGRDETERAQRFMARLGDHEQRLYVAYEDGAPIAAGHLEFNGDRPFAGLWGGGTVPEQRGRGVYRALVAARAAEARRRGARYLTVDARETSRPILQRLGFQPLAMVRGWTLDGP
jgi:GNAT superfamily N-acetyltransferase